MCKAAEKKDDELGGEVVTGRKSNLLYMRLGVLCSIRRKSTAFLREEKKDDLEERGRYLRKAKAQQKV